MIVIGLLGVMFMLFLILMSLEKLNDTLRAAMERRYGGQ